MDKNIQPPTEIDEIYKSYLAGFFDGEGCVSILRQRCVRRVSVQYKISVVITQTQRELLDEIVCKLGYGKDLLKHLAQICKERRYGRFQWWVLDWNTSAIDFYTSLGAKAMDEWTVYRISGAELSELALEDR